MYGGASTRARSSLVGRSAELQQLRALYGRACQEAGGLGLIWGEAGVGKTRLLDEFAMLAAEAGARVATASCFEYSCPPFAPLYEVFAALGLAIPFEAGPVRVIAGERRGNEVSIFRRGSRSVENIRQSVADYHVPRRPSMG